MALQRAADEVDEALVALELDHRDVDREAEIGVAQGGTGDIGAGTVDHPPAELDNGARLLGEADEASGRQEALFRMVPADQRFDRGRPPLDQVDPRLIVQFELVPLDPPSECCVEQQTATLVTVQVRVEKHDLIPAPAFCPVHRRIGAPEQLVR